MKLEVIRLSEINQTQKEKYFRLLFTHVTYIEAENRMVVTTGREMGERGNVGHRTQNCSSAGCVRSRGLVNTLTVVNNTVLYSQNLLRE